MNHPGMTTDGLDGIGTALSGTDHCRRLLIVDDEPHARASLERLLVTRGFQVTAVADGDQALESLEREHFDVVLLDLIMSGTSATQVMDHIAGAGLETAVVVVSGTRSVPEATLALRHGAQDFVCKPYRFDELLRRIAAACRRLALQRSRAAMQARLRDSERLHRFLVHSSPDLIFLLDAQGRFRFINERLTNFLHFAPEAMLERPMLDLVVPAHRGHASTLLSELARAPEGTTRTLELRMLRADGPDPLPMEIKLLALAPTAEGVALADIFGVARDLSERQRAQEAMRRTNDLLQHVIDTSPAVIYARQPNEARVLTFVSDNLKDLLGYLPNQLLSGDIAWRDLVHPDDLRRMEHDLDCLEERLNASSEYRMRHRNDGWRWVRDSVRLLCDSAGRPVELVGSWLDNTEAHLLSEQLKLQASLDSLTGLLNRRAFERCLQRALETARREGCAHALCYLDLDQFKVINDTCGHIAGDAVLRQLAHLLEGCIRKQDTLARLGGDEFGVLMEHCDTEGAMRVAKGLCKAVNDFRFVWSDKSFRLGVSIGMVPIDRTSHGLNAVLSAADTACYAAKDAGRNRIHIHTEDDVELARRHGEMQWVSRINQALEQNRFGLAFQPIVPVSEAPNGRHYELLLRMFDETGVTILPGAFLPAAERYNLVGRLDQWVLDTAMSWLCENDRHLQDITLCSINLSGHSLGDERLLDRLATRLRTQGPEPSKLCFEVTETAAISNMYNAVDFIRTLRQMGCRFALDDFGSGLSSFAYLKNLPVDFIKIDGVFVEDIATNPVAHAMVRAINEIGQVMGMKTVAEFVDSEQTLETLRTIGVDYAQGYGIGRPRPIEELLGA